MENRVSLPDFHSHILPRADHGSDSVETSLQSLKLASEIGITKLFATPHFYPHKHTVAGFLERRNNAFLALKEALSGCENVCPSIRLGAEVLICPNLDELDGLENLCILGTKTLLLELPFHDFREDYVDTVESLLSDGYRVILAHADRYDGRNIDRLVHLGAEIQLNATPFGNLFLPSDVKRWLAEEKVIALGSDIHMAEKEAYRLFAKAEKRLGDAYDRILKQSSAIFDEAKDL